MTKQSRPVTWRISEEVETAMKSLADEYRGIDKALRILLFAGKLKPGDFAKLGGKYICRVIEAQSFGFLRVLLVEDPIEVFAHIGDLTPYKPSQSELLSWKLLK